MSYLMVLKQTVALTFMALSTLLGFVFLFIGIRLARYDYTMLKKSRERYASLLDFIKGRAQPSYGYIADSIIQGGMTYDFNKRKIIRNGKLSDEAVAEFLED
jgi:hypothetical protein